MDDPLLMRCPSFRGETSTLKGCDQVVKIEHQHVTLNAHKEIDEAEEV